MKHEYTTTTRSIHSIAVLKRHTLGVGSYCKHNGDCARILSPDASRTFFSNTIHSVAPTLLFIYAIPQSKTLLKVYSFTHKDRKLIKYIKFTNNENEIGVRATSDRRDWRWRSGQRWWLSLPPPQRLLSEHATRCRQQPGDTDAECSPESARLGNLADRR